MFTYFLFFNLAMIWYDPFPWGFFAAMGSLITVGVQFGAVVGSSEAWSIWCWSGCLLIGYFVLCPPALARRSRDAFSDRAAARAAIRARFLPSHWRSDPPGALAPRAVLEDVPAPHDIVAAPSPAEVPGMDAGDTPDRCAAPDPPYNSPEHPHAYAAAMRQCDGPMGYPYSCGSPMRPYTFDAPHPDPYAAPVAPYPPPFAMQPPSWYPRHY